LKPIIIGLAKGYLLKESLDFFRKFGIEVDINNDRQLVFFDKTGLYKFLLLRPSDVPVYVEHGAVDMGITGMDIIREYNADIMIIRDLGFGYCRLVVAKSKDKEEAVFRNGIKVATKFINCTKQFFSEIGVKADLIKLYGSVELAGVTGLSDYVVDLVASGKTLQENNLEETNIIFESTAHLIVNKVFYSLNTENLNKFFRG